MGDGGTEVPVLTLEEDEVPDVDLEAPRESCKEIRVEERLEVHHLAPESKMTQLNVTYHLK